MYAFKNDTEFDSPFVTPTMHGDKGAVLEATESFDGPLILAGEMDDEDDELTYADFEGETDDNAPESVFAEDEFEFEDVFDERENDDRDEPLDTESFSEGFARRSEPSDEGEDPAGIDYFDDMLEPSLDDETIPSSEFASDLAADELLDNQVANARKLAADALQAAIAGGLRDEVKLTNLVFFSRHAELKHGRLDRKHPKFRRLSREWAVIRRREVWPAIRRSAANASLVVAGKDVAVYFRQFSGRNGKRFKKLIEVAAKRVDLNPGLLAATLLAETARRSNYLTRGKVSSYRIGVDDFFDRRHALKKRVPAFSQVRWDRHQKLDVHHNDRQKNPRKVKTILFDSGPDGLLASAVYLKFGEVRLRENAEKLGGKFDTLSLETQWQLIRMAFNAGVGGATKRLVRALKGTDILVRKNLPRKIYRTDRNSTIHTARALHLSDWIFGIPISTAPQPELEMPFDLEDDSDSFSGIRTDQEFEWDRMEASPGADLADEFEDDSDLDDEEWEEADEQAGVVSHERVEVADESLQDTEFFDEEDMESGVRESAYDSNFDDEAYFEIPDIEQETSKQSAILPRMKFEFQTRNEIWRNDGRVAPQLLGRKYGPLDYLVRKKRVRLESETKGVLEFETKWLRKWSGLQKAINSAIKMTDEMNTADPAKFDRSRQDFPFDVSDLRKATAKERRQGYWNRRRGKEGSREKFLGANEELEVNIIDDKWRAAIQSSESFLLHQYESYLKQHVSKSRSDEAIENAEAILEAVRPNAIPKEKLVNLQSLLQIIAYYIRQGQAVHLVKRVPGPDGSSVREGHPSKFAFALMTRTNFSSIYKRLLNRTERRLFIKLVRNNVILNRMGLDRRDPFFIKGYGSKKHYPGPSVYKWLSGIHRGRDYLSARSTSGLSAAMGRYNVEKRRGEKDRWLVKFETRSTKMKIGGVPIGRSKDAGEWINYASTLYEFALKRRRRPVSSLLSPLADDADRFLELIATGNLRAAAALADRHGVSDENKLTSLIFHSFFPELAGRRLRKKERTFVKRWLQLRKETVRPYLQDGGVREAEVFRENFPEEDGPALSSTNESFDDEDLYQIQSDEFFDANLAEEFAADEL